MYVDKESHKNTSLFISFVVIGVIGVPPDSRKKLMPQLYAVRKNPHSARRDGDHNFPIARNVLTWVSATDLYRVNSVLLYISR